MSDSPMTFCISTFNNLNYLKLAVHSVRTYSHFKDAPFIIYSENSTDGTNEWLMSEGKEKYNLEVYVENNAVPIGIGGGMNFCAERVKTKYIMFLHADFFVGKDWDIEALKAMEEGPIIEPELAGFWVSSFRIQPNIFKENHRPGTLMVDESEFGEYHHNFNEKYFIEWSSEFTKDNDVWIRKGEGVSGLIKKIDWDAVGGNDERFRPAYFEDYDLFVRMQLANYGFILTSKSIVYHFGSRASRFPDDDLTQRKPELANHEKNSFEQWMKKWGKPPEFDYNGFIMPIQGTNNTIRV
jgi:GT2 family glycosyltransferase